MASSELEIDFSEDGAASTDWWTKEADEILSALGPPASEFEDLNRNPWCG